MGPSFRKFCQSSINSDFLVSSQFTAPMVCNCESAGLSSRFLFLGPICGVEMTVEMEIENWPLKFQLWHEDAFPWIFQIQFVSVSAQSNYMLSGLKLIVST